MSDDPQGPADPSRPWPPPPPVPPPPPPPPGPAPGSRPAAAGATAIGGRILPIRAMSVGDVLDGSFGGLRATFVPVALIVVLLLGPLQLLLNLVLSRLAPGIVGGGLMGALGQVDDAVGAGTPEAVVGVGTLAAVLSFLISLVVGAATVALLLQADRGEEPTAATAVRAALSVIGTTLGASVLIGLGGFASILALGLLGALLGAAVPGPGAVLVVVVFLPAFLLGLVAFLGVINLVVPIAIVERTGPIATIGRALWVLRRRFWRLLGITVLVGILVAIASLGLQLPFVLLGGVLTPVAWIVESIGEVLAQVVAVPVTAFAALLVYLDARVRYEGLDLQLRTRHLDER